MNCKNRHTAHKLCPSKRGLDVYVEKFIYHGNKIYSFLFLGFLRAILPCVRREVFGEPAHDSHKLSLFVYVSSLHSSQHTTIPTPLHVWPVNTPTEGVWPVNTPSVQYLSHGRKSSLVQKNLCGARQSAEGKSKRSDPTKRSFRWQHPTCVGFVTSLTKTAHRELYSEHVQLMYKAVKTAREAICCMRKR